MNITILDDWQDTIRSLPAFKKVADHNVTVWKDHTKDVDALADRLKDTEVLVLIRERTPIGAPLIERLPKLSMITQAGVFPHIDVAAHEARRHHLVEPDAGPALVRDRGADLGPDHRGDAPHPAGGRGAKAGRWQAFPIGSGLRGKTLGILGYGKIGGGGGGLRQGVRDERDRVGPPDHARQGARRRLRGGEEPRGLLRRIRCRLAPPPPQPRDARHRHRRGPRAHEADRADRQHQPRRADRARRARGGAEGGTAGHGGGGRVRGGARGGRQSSAARDGQRGLRCRTSATSSTTASRHVRTIFDQVVAYAAGKPINVQNPEAAGDRPKS